MLKSYLALSLLDINTNTPGAGPVIIESPISNGDSTVTATNRIPAQPRIPKTSNGGFVARYLQALQTGTGVADNAKTVKRNLEEIFSGKVPEMPHIRREDFRAPQISGEENSHLYRSSMELENHLANLSSKEVIEKKKRSALVSGPLGPDVQDIVLKRAVKSFQAESDPANNSKSNIVIFCANDIACDAAARRMIRLSERKARPQILAAMRTIRDDSVYAKYKKENDANPKIIFVNTHSVKAKIKSTHSFDELNKRLNKLNDILDLGNLRYLYFCQAHEITTATNENLLDFLIRKTESKSETRPLELVGSTYFNPIRGDSEEESIKLEDHFERKIFLPNSPDTLINLGKMPRLDENGTHRITTNVGEKIPGIKTSKSSNGVSLTKLLEQEELHDQQVDEYLLSPNGNLPNLNEAVEEAKKVTNSTVTLKSVLSDDKFLDEIIDKYFVNRPKHYARNVIELEPSKEVLEKLTNKLKDRNIKFAILTGEEVAWFDESGIKHNDFNSRIETFDRLGKDYPLLIHFNDYTEPLATGLEIPVDNKILLCLPSADDQVEAALAGLRTRYPQTRTGTVNHHDRGLVYLERSADNQNKRARFKKSITEMILKDIDLRHSKANRAEGRLIKNRSELGVNTKSKIDPNTGSVTNTDDVAFKNEDIEWFEFIAEALNIKNEGDDNQFAQTVDAEINDYAELITQDLAKRFPDSGLHAERVAKILKGQEPYDRYKREVIEYFLDNESQFITAAVKFPHIVGIKTEKEALAKLKFETNNLNLSPNFNQTWLKELDTVSTNKTFELVADFLLNHGDKYGSPLIDNDLLQNALLVILGTQKTYCASEPEAQKLFHDFYDFANHRYALIAPRVNQILAETEIAKAGLKFDFKTSLGDTKRREDFDLNLSEVLKDKSLFTTNASWLKLIYESLAISRTTDDFKNQKLNELLSNYIASLEPKPAALINSEAHFKNFIAVLLGNMPDQSLMSLNEAKTLFNQFISFVNSNAPRRLEASSIKSAVPSLFDASQQLNDLTAVKSYILNLANTGNPKIDPATNWSKLLEQYYTNANGAYEARGKTLYLIAEFLFEKHRDLFTKPNDKDLKKIISLLACHNSANGNGTNGEKSTVEFAEFCDWLQSKKPDLNISAIKIAKHSDRDKTYYQPENRINAENAKFAVEYVFSNEHKEKPNANQDWLTYLSTLVAPPQTTMDIFAEYLISLRSKTPAIEVFGSFESLKKELAIISGNGNAKDDATKVAYKERFVDFTSFLQKKFKKYDPNQARKLFPQYVDFQETIRTKALLKSNIAKQLETIFAKTQMPIVFQDLFGPINNNSLSEFITEFCKNSDLSTITTEAEFENLLRVILGLNRYKKDSKEEELIRSFLDYLLQNFGTVINGLNLYSQYPKLIDLSEEINSASFEEFKNITVEVFNKLENKASNYWFQYLDKLNEGKNYLDIFAEYLFNLRSQTQANGLTLKFQELKGCLSVISCNADSDPNSLIIFENFIDYLQQYSDKPFFDATPIRANFPQYISLEKTLQLTKQIEKSDAEQNLKQKTGILGTLVYFIGRDPDLSTHIKDLTWLKHLDLVYYGTSASVSKETDDQKWLAKCYMIAKFLVENSPDYPNNKTNLISAIKILLGFEEEIKKDTEKSKNLILDFNKDLQRGNPMYKISYRNLNSCFPYLGFTTKGVVQEVINSNPKLLQAALDDDFKSELTNLLKTEFGLTVTEAGKLLELDLLDIERFWNAIAVSLWGHFPAMYSKELKISSLDIMKRSILPTLTTAFSPEKQYSKAIQNSLSISKKENDPLYGITKYFKIQATDTTATLNIEIYKDKIICRYIDPEYLDEGFETTLTFIDTSFNQVRETIKSIRSIPSHK